MRTLRWAAIIAACLAPSSLSAQADFTFTVPVEVKAIHESVTQFAVTCHALTQSGQRVRTGSTDIALDAEGSYSGPVVVEANQSQQGLPAGDAARYECHFYMQPGGYHLGHVATSALPTEAQPKPDTPTTVMVQGSVP